MQKSSGIVATGLDHAEVARRTEKAAAGLGMRAKIRELVWAVDSRRRAEADEKIRPRASRC